MAGRGFPSEVEPIVNNDIVILCNGRWRPMYVPVNPDRRTAGINLAESFADLYAREKNVTVGLIPCADGGTSLDQWQVGGGKHKSYGISVHLPRECTQNFGTPGTVILWKK